MPVPYGTLFVNVSGSFVLGLLVTGLVSRSASPELRALLTIGLCGGYTTFSMFAWESAVLMEGGRFARLLVYVTLSIVLTIAAMLARLSAGRVFLR